jgi:hypothetical protein
MAIRSHTPDEIAVSIAAELIQVRNAPRRVHVGGQVRAALQAAVGAVNATPRYGRRVKTRRRTLTSARRR